ncbi:MAG: hypothetical protein EA382_17580 [Spirochaetaceae bacterium]|nr:MAG: hypothetical protein EA382_17580 [Spirochaetaceae bacterium]
MVKYLGAIVALALLGSCVVIPDRAFDQRRYLGQGEHDPSIYSGPPNGTFLPVFTLESHRNVRGRIVSLLLVEFIDDPRYYMLELQEAVDGQHTGMIALLYHHANASVDVYFTPGLQVDRSSYTALLNDVSFIEAEFDATLALTDTGLSADLTLVDRFGDLVTLSIREGSSRASEKPNGLLAPIASGSDSPDRFPFIYLKRFTLIPIRGSLIDLRIGGRRQRIDTIPAIVNGRRVYNAKYSFENVMIDWNLDRHESVTPLPYVPRVSESVTADGTMRVLNDNHGYPEVERIVRFVGDNAFVLIFSPSFPDVTALADRVTVDGRFSVQVDQNEGILGGWYRVTQQRDVTLIELGIEKGWQPMPGALWMNGYRWTALIERSPDSSHLTTSWRNER